MEIQNKGYSKNTSYNERTRIQKERRRGTATSRYKTRIQLQAVRDARCKRRRDTVQQNRNRKQRLQQGEYKLQTTREAGYNRKRYRLHRWNKT